MARADTVTLLSLDRYAEILGMDPRWFNTVNHANLPVPTGPHCDPFWFQREWQYVDYVSREELARAVYQAEMMIAGHLGFFPAPAWVEAETMRYPEQPIGYGSGISFTPLRLDAGRRPAVSTRWGHVVAGGRETWTLLSAGAAVNYTDPHALGFNHLADVTFNTAVSLLGKEVRLVPAGTATADLARYQIRGLRVTKTGNIVYSEGHACKFVVPALWEGPSQLLVDGDNPASFLEEVDAYRLWNSDQGTAKAAVILGSEELCDPACSLVPDYGCLIVKRPTSGLVALAPATWDTTTSSWIPVCPTTRPEVALVYYLSGYPTDDLGEVAPPLDKAVAMLATALLGKPICGCGHMQKLAEHWQSIRGTTDESGHTPPASLKQLEDCPFGPQNGAYEAWLLLRYFSAMHSVNLGG